MRFVSWNVNGIRAVLKKNFLEVFDAFNADIFAIQETKCQVGQVELDLPGYHQYWSAAEKKGYSGTAVFTREEPLRVLHGLGNEYLDAEGRIVACEFPQFWFVNVYTPNSQMELARIDHRMEWDDAFRDFCKGLEAGVLPDGASSDPKPVVMCGDFNVAHEEIDLKNPGPNRGPAPAAWRRPSSARAQAFWRRCRRGRTSSSWPSRESSARVSTSPATWTIWPCAAQASLPSSSAVPTA